METIRHRKYSIQRNKKKTDRIKLNTEKKADLTAEYIYAIKLSGKFFIKSQHFILQINRKI